MEFLVQYVIDGVGYYKSATAKNESDVRVEVEAELKKAYPASVCGVTSVETIEKPKKGKVKDDDKEGK